MAVIEWNETTMGTDVESVDREHRQLVDEVNALLEADSQGKGREEIQRMIASLDRSMDEHFRHEEETMAEHRLASSAENRAAHGKFMIEYRALARRFENEGPTLAFVVDLQRDVAHWLVAHVKRCRVQFRQRSLAGRH